MEKQTGPIGRALETLRSKYVLRGDPGFRGQHFALSVKCYEGPEDLTDEELAEVLSEHGIEPGSKCPPVPGAEPLKFRQWVQAQDEVGAWDAATFSAWDAADEFVGELFEGVPLARGVELESAGRSGGWAVLRGIDARETLDALEDFAELEPVRAALSKVREERSHFADARVAYPGPILGDEDHADALDAQIQELEDELLRLARERELEGYAEALALRLELEREPSPESEAELRDALSLFDVDTIPEPEDIDPPELPEPNTLLELAYALAELARYVDAQVENWPRTLAWYHASEFADAIECYSEDVQRGDALLELARLAGSVVAHVLEDPAPDEELRALAEGLERTLSDVSKRWPAGRVCAELRSAPSTEGR